MDGGRWVWVTPVLHTQPRGQPRVCVSPAIKQHRLSTPAIQRHQFGCQHPGDTLSDILGTVTPPLPPPPPLCGDGIKHTHKARRRVQLVSFIAGDGDKAVAGRGGGVGGCVRPPWGGDKGDSVVTLTHLHPPLPGRFNTGGSAWSGR